MRMAEKRIILKVQLNFILEIITGKSHQENQKY
jgi:hypothetical protein